MNVQVIQFPITFDIRRNCEVILSAAAAAQAQTLVVLPEGALSGYADDLSFLAEIDPALLRRCLGRIRAAVARQGIHLIFGSCWPERRRWYNAAFYAGPQGERFIYRKINLATHERGTFTAGDELPVLRTVIAGRETKIGVQLCREIRFPEQWQSLARAGAEVFAYLTNAVGEPQHAAASEEEAIVWRSHLVSRAAENQRFVLCANTAHPAQKCPSLIVNPRGRVLWEALSAEYAVGSADLNLAQVSDWYLSQSRRDVVGVRA